jgi:hypothetical protein
MSVDFGQHLKNLVADAGLTVAAFAKAIDCHPDAPQKWFSGKSYPHRKYHKKMATVLGVTTESLLMMSTAGGTQKTETITERKEAEENVDLEIFKAIMSIQRRLDSLDERLTGMEIEVRRLSGHPLPNAPRSNLSG